MPDEINLEMHDGDVQPGPTSDVNPEMETHEEKPETEEEVKAEEKKETEEIIDYQERYAESTREFQKLHAQMKENEALTEQQRSRVTQLETERDEALSRLKEEHPEAYDNATLHKAVTDSNRQLAELKEKVELDSFITENPIAKEYREALKQHARAFPNKSLADIWETGFKTVAETTAKAQETKAANQKVTQPEKGKVTPELGTKMISGYTEAEFNKLPVSKRREILIENGVEV